MIFITAIVPFYLLGRLYFACIPLAINFFNLEKECWYNNWNRQRFIIVSTLCITSFTLSIFWGQRILAEMQAGNIDYNLIQSYVVLQVLSYVLFELKMEHPFRPVKAIKIFIRTNYKERFQFFKNPNVFDLIERQYLQIKEELSNGIEFISEKLQKQEASFKETNELAKLNNKLLQESDFAFEIKKNPNMVVNDILQDYFISKDSERILSDFLLRKKKSGKILFTRPAKNGVSVKQILDFFSTFTNLIENCRSNEITKAETIKIINTIASAKDRLGKVIEEPINTKNLSKYLSGGDFRQEI